MGEDYQVFIWVTDDSGINQVLVGTGKDVEEARNAIQSELDHSDPLFMVVEYDPDYILDGSGETAIIVD